MYLLSFHALSAKVSSSFPVLAIALLTKSLSGKVAVKRVIMSRTDQP